MKTTKFTESKIIAFARNQYVGNGIIRWVMIEKDTKNFI